MTSNTLRPIPFNDAASEVVPRLYNVMVMPQVAGPFTLSIVPERRLIKNADGFARVEKFNKADCYGIDCLGFFFSYLFKLSAK